MGSAADRRWRPSPTRQSSVLPGQLSWIKQEGNGEGQSGSTNRMPPVNSSVIGTVLPSHSVCLPTDWSSVRWSSTSTSSRCGSGTSTPTPATRSRLELAWTAWPRSAHRSSRSTRGATHEEATTVTGTFGITQGVKLCDTVDPPSSQTAQHHVARAAPPRSASIHVGSPVHVRCYAARLSDRSGTIVCTVVRRPVPHRSITAGHRH